MVFWERLFDLSEKQKILYEFVEKKFISGMSLEDIENVLVECFDEGLYDELDVLKVINFALKKKLERGDKFSLFEKPKSKIDSEEKLRAVAFGKIRVEEL